MRTRLVPYLRQLEGCDVEVCVDIDESAARTIQQMSRAKSWVNRIEEVDTSKIDAALIALPANVAYQVTSYLIKQGIACFVEKPPASTTDEINLLAQLASAMEVYVQVGFNFRFSEAMVAFHTHTASYRIDPCTPPLEFIIKNPSGL